MIVLVVMWFNGATWIIPGGWEPRAAPDFVTCEKRLRFAERYLADPLFRFKCMRV